MYPAGQSVHTDAPEDEYLPAGQFWHADIEFDPVDGLKVLFEFNFFHKIKYYVIRSLFYFALKLKQELK